MPWPKSNASISIGLARRYFWRRVDLLTARLTHLMFADETHVAPWVTRRPIRRACGRWGTWSPPVATFPSDPLPCRHLRPCPDQVPWARGTTNGQDQDKSRKAWHDGRSRRAAGAQIRRVRSRQVRLAQAETGQNRSPQAEIFASVGDGAAETAIESRADATGGQRRNPPRGRQRIGGCRGAVAVDRRDDRAPVWGVQRLDPTCRRQRVHAGVPRRRHRQACWLRLSPVKYQGRRPKPAGHGGGRESADPHSGPRPA